MYSILKLSNAIQHRCPFVCKRTFVHTYLGRSHITSAHVALCDDIDLIQSIKLLLLRVAYKPVLLFVYLQGFAAHLVSTFSEWGMALFFGAYFFTHIRDFAKFDVSLQLICHVAHLDADPSSPVVRSTLDRNLREPDEQTPPPALRVISEVKTTKTNSNQNQTTTRTKE